MHKIVKALLLAALLAAPFCLATPADAQVVIETGGSGYHHHGHYYHHRYYRHHHYYYR